MHAHVSQTRAEDLLCRCAHAWIHGATAPSGAANARLDVGLDRAALGPYCALCVDAIVVGIRVSQTCNAGKALQQFVFFQKLCFLVCLFPIWFALCPGSSRR